VTRAALETMAVNEMGIYEKREKMEMRCDDMGREGMR
jgi:hypothetical protein